MDPELLSLDDLPREAREAIDAVEREIADLREQANRQAAEIRARADQSAVEIEQRAESEIQQRQLALFHHLRPMQQRYARDGQLDEALAIRERIRSLRAQLLLAQADPGTLSHVRDPEVGSSQLFEVVGSTDGVVWGTDTYTSDSSLAAVAVHAGVLAEGERGVIRVTFIDTLNVDFVGTERHGVWSQDFGAWPVGFRVSRA